MDESIKKLEDLIQNRPLPSMPSGMRERIMAKAKADYGAEECRKVIDLQWVVAAAALVMLWCNMLIPNFSRDFADHPTLRANSQQVDRLQKKLLEEVPELGERESRRQAMLIVLSGRKYFGN